MEEEQLTLNVRMPTSEEVARARDVLADLKDGQPGTISQVYARETLLLSELPPVRLLKLQAIRIGDLGLTAMPNEVFGSIGLTIKQKSPLQPTVNIELANGYHGYIPLPDQFPFGGYTTWRARSSCLEIEAAPKITTAVPKLLNKVAQRRRQEAAIASP